MPYLQPLSGPLVGRLVQLSGEEITLGRHPTCTIRITGPSVSRLHAEIRQQDGRLVFRDIGSRNGTEINGQPVRGPHTLVPGDRIRICKSLLVYLDEPPAPDASTDTDLTLDESPLNLGSVEVFVPQGESAPRTGDSRTAEHDVFVPPGKPAGADADGGENGSRAKDDGSSVIKTIKTGSDSDLNLDADPLTKLEAVLELGHALGQNLDVSESMDLVLDALFRIFPQADEGHFLTPHPRTGRLQVVVGRHRESQSTGRQPSHTIVHRALTNKEAILSGNTHADFEDSESVSHLGIRSSICVPLLSRESEETLGAIQINSHDFFKAFSPEDLEVLVAVSSQIVVALEYARLVDAVTRQRDMERDTQFAIQVQRGFLPAAPPDIVGYEFANHYAAALSVGGDYYDYVYMTEGRVAIVIADVAGSGTAAALLMARLYSTLRSHLLYEDSAAAALQRTNADLYAANSQARFVTCCVCVLDPARHTLTLANAGHPPPMHRSGSTVERLPVTWSGVALAIKGEAEYEEHTMSLSAGEELVFYTDGITEARSQSGDLFHADRLARSLARRYRTAEDVIEGVLSDVDAHTVDHPGQSDDTCLVVLRRLP